MTDVIDAGFSSNKTFATTKVEKIKNYKAIVKRLMQEGNNPQKVLAPEDIKRFCIARRYDVEDTYELLKKHLEFRQV